MLRRYRRRTREERILAHGLIVLFVLAHLLTRWTSLAQARHRLSAMARALRVRAADADQLRWGVAAVAAHLPGRHSCLIKALACDAVAAASGIPTEFQLGAARTDGKLCFHAWVEHAGQTISDVDHGDFLPLA